MTAAEALNRRGVAASYVCAPPKRVTFSLFVVSLPLVPCLFLPCFVSDEATNLEIARFQLLLDSAN